MVPRVGVEPTNLAVVDFESTLKTILKFMIYIIL